MRCRRWRLARRTGAAAVAAWLTAGGWAPALATGQGVATLRVVVMDQTGGTIEGARVAVVPVSLGRRAAAAGRATDRRGEAWFRDCQPGAYLVTVEAPGFEPWRIETLRLCEGDNRVEARLGLARVVEEVTVGRTRRDAALDARGGAFATVLGPDEIAQLPPDPDELRAVLEQMGGPGAVIRVNGFRGGRLPPLSQIREIRFHRDPYAAEHHESGLVAIDVATRPGATAFGGAADVSVKNAVLAARHAVAAPSRTEQRQRASAEASGPIERGRSSFGVAVDATRAQDRAAIHVALPGATASGVAVQPSVQVRAMLRFERQTGGARTFRGEWQGVRARHDNQGVGGISLPERAVSQSTGQQMLRLFWGGPAGRSVYHEARLQLRHDTSRVIPQSDRPALLVPGALAAGGAQVSGWRHDQVVEMSEDVDVARGRHAWRLGGRLEVVRRSSNESVNAGGTFTFAGLQSFAAGRPQLFVQRVGHAAVRLSHVQAAWYVQNQWRVHDALALALGVRGEAQSRVAGRLHAAPRLGFTWSPARGGTTAIRGGVGLFNGWVDASIWELLDRVDGVRQHDLAVFDPGFPAPLANERAVAFPGGRYEVDPDVRLPRTVRVTVGLDRQVSPALRITAAYTEERGRHQLRGRDRNAPEPGHARPFPQFGAITRIESHGRAAARAVDVTAFLIRPAGRLLLAASYRWARAFNETDDPFSLPADSRAPGADWGPAASDLRHRVAAFFSVRPFDQLRVGITVAGASAPPYTVTTGHDDNGDAAANDRPPGTSRHGARGAAFFDVSGRASWVIPLGRRAADAQAGADSRVGVTARAAGVRSDEPQRRPQSWSARLEVYVSAQNLLNRANPVGYCGVLTSPFFGQALSVAPPRRVEVGTRVAF